MDIPVFFWVALAIIGFVLGLWITLKALLRIALGLFMLTGLALVLANTSGNEDVAFWLGVSMAGLVVVFAVGLLGAICGRLVRRTVGGEEPRRHEREYNTIV
jgi:hypothetical protein